MKRWVSVRLLTYILVGGGAAIAVVALAVVLLDNGETKSVEPQADAGEWVVAVQHHFAIGNGSNGLFIDTPRGSGMANVNATMPLSVITKKIVS